ncbi:hypothetical protein [Cryptosporangium japonicum]|uniref:Uncharacterized protein n=1 Tax=Cryptosporangium japonicum TaxID=80872 RepID=A0ABP3EEH2_9ACTN
MPVHQSNAIEVPDEGPTVVMLDEREYLEAVEHTLHELGYTREELRGWAATRDFPDPLAFMAWQMIRDDAVA